MEIQKEEIIDYALRYIDKDEITDFPDKNDIFCTYVRQIPDNKILKDDEGWQFGGYSVCRRYLLDDLEKPVGKWIWFEYVSLLTFPPQKLVLKLQPPHIAKGLYQDPSRTHEFRIVRVDLDLELPQEEAEKSSQEQSGDNILQFPIKK